MLWLTETAKVIDSCQVVIPKSFEGYADLPFTKKKEQKHFAVSIEANENLSWRKRVWIAGSFVTFEKEGNTIIQRENEGRELLFSSQAEIKADCSPENIINGKNRQTLTALNGWVSDRKQGLPASVTLTLEKEQEISEVRITTYVDLSYPNYCFQANPVFTGTAEDMTVSILQNGNWKEVCAIKGNCFKQAVARFEKQKACAVKVTVTKTINSSSAHITEVRIY